MNPESSAQAPLQSPKNKGKKNILIVIIALIVVALVVVGIAMVARNTGKKSPTQLAKQQAEVTITSTGFNPATISVAKGTTVTWKNADNARHQVASEPYPSHSNLEGLFSIEPLNTGDTYSYTFNEAGTFNYLDQLNPYKVKGVVIVK
jgi:plastocyanin